MALQHHLLQLLDLHPSQVGQLPVALVGIDEGIQGHVAIQERIGHILLTEVKRFWRDSFFFNTPTKRVDIEP